MKQFEVTYNLGSSQIRTATVPARTSRSAYNKATKRNPRARLISVREVV